MTESGHLPRGTEFANDVGAEAYAQNRHGPDGNQLLDPYFMPILQALSPESDVIDIGCGAAPWAVASLQAGANRVLAFDFSEQMIRQADATAKDLGKDNLWLVQGDANAIPAQNGSFDLALNINVGCNLPELLPHFREMARVLKPGGRAVFTAPASLTTAFTAAGHEADVSDLAAALATVDVQDTEQMKKVVGSYQDIYRATVVAGTHHWHVVTQENPLSLRLGQPIWRKIPGLVVPNYNHTEAEYTMAIQRAGLSIGEAYRPQLDSAYPDTAGLGTHYAEYNPFIVYTLHKII